MNSLAETHPAAPQTARWPAPRCPACCGGGGSASWSCSRAWTGTAGSAPARRTPPGPQAATARRTRPAGTRRDPGRACRLQFSVPQGELNPNGVSLLMGAFLPLVSGLRAAGGGGRGRLHLLLFLCPSFSTRPPSSLSSFLTFSFCSYPPN